LHYKPHPIPFGLDLLRIETDLKRWSTSYLSTTLDSITFDSYLSRVSEDSSEELDLPSASGKVTRTLTPDLTGDTPQEADKV